MTEFGIPRRVWRAIYPTLLYLLITAVVSIVFAVVHAVASIDTKQLINGSLTVEGIAYGVMEYVAENALLISLCGYVAALAVFVPMWIKTKKRYPRWNGGEFSIPVALCAVGAAIGFNMILSVIITVTGVIELFPSYDLVSDVISSGSFSLQIIAVGLIGPVTEELCFRGITQNRMSDTRIWLAIGAQTVLFGLLHMNIVQSTYAALLGVFLGFLTVRYRSIIYAIIAHIAFNMFSIGINTIEDESVIIIIGIAIIPVTAVSIIGFIKCKRPEPYVAPEIEAVIMPVPESPEPEL